MDLFDLIYSILSVSTRLPVNRQAADCISAGTEEPVWLLGSITKRKEKKNLKEREEGSAEAGQYPTVNG